MKTTFSRMIGKTVVLIPFLFTALAAAQIHDAAKAGDLAQLKALVEKEPALIHSRDETGRTPLHWACRGVHGDVVRYLVERGADINAADANGTTPLHSVASRGHLPVATLLVDAGARLDARMYDQATPLHLAARGGYQEVVSLLLEKGAPLDVRDGYEDTPLHAAAREGKGAAAETLANAILDKDPALLDMVDGDGCTALHAAARNGHAQVVALLVARGAGINIRNTLGRTAFNLAKEGGFQEIAASLVQKGADQSGPKFPRLPGPYLGQASPGTTPQLFAKGIVSTRLGMYGTIAFSPDGQEAFWKPNSDKMLFTKMENGSWCAPQEFPFLERYAANAPFYSVDGKRLFFMAGLPDAQGMVGKEEIWVAERSGRGWSEPKPFDAAVNALPMHWQCSMDSRGNVYVGNSNIFCARLEQGRYIAPKKLPPAINTEHREPYEGEVGPFISPRGDCLIFTRFMRHARFPVQLFISFRKKDGSWGEAKNLSERLGTHGNDSMAKVSPDGKYLFFQSVRPGSVPERSLYWVDARVIGELRSE